MKNLSKPNSKGTKLGTFAILIALLMMLSLVANVGAVVHDLTPDYTAPGTSIDILSWDIYGPSGGVHLQKVDVAYNGTDTTDVDWANLYINGSLVQTLYGPEGFFLLTGNNFIPEGDMVTVTLEFVISSTATHGNHVDGKISDYAMSKSGATGTDLQPIDPVGHTIIDATAPTLTKTLVGTMGLNGWYTTDVDVSLNATDLEFGVDYVEYNLNGGGWTKNYASYATNHVVNFTISVEGNNSLAHRVYDGAGNNYTLPTQYIAIDKTIPTLTKDLDGVEGSVSPWWGSDVKVTFTAGDAHSGVDYVEYSYDNSTWYTYTTPFNISAAGTTYLYHRVYDVAGWSYELANQTIKIDKVDPTLTKTLVGTMGLNGWYISDVNVTLNGTDTGGSGLDKVEYNLNGGGWTTYSGSFNITVEGNNSLEHRVYDNAGRSYVLPKQYIPIDKTAPDLTKVLTGTTGSAPWYVSDVTVTLTAVEAHSGVDKVEYNLNGGGWTTYTVPFIISAGGNNTLAHRVYDVAGWSFVLPTQYIPIDKVDPTLTKTLVGTMGLNGWYISDVNVTLNGTDTGGSGLDKVEYNLNGGGWTTYTASFNITVEGNNTLAHRVYDNAGRSYVLPTQYIPIDKTAPTLSKGLAGTPGSVSPWYISDVTVTLTAVEAHSGVDKVEYNLNGGGWTTYIAPFTISTGGINTLYHRVYDKAGWSYELPWQYIQIDKYAPTLTKTLVGTPGNAPWWVSEVNVTLTGADTGGSGLDKVEYNLNGGGWTTYTASFNITVEGNNTLEHRVYDNAGSVYVLPKQYIPIDTIAPFAIDIEVSDTFIKQDDVGDTFEVNVTFSEAMNPAVIPDITFDPDVSSTLVYDSDAWSAGNTVYKRFYDIVDANVTIYDIDVTVGGAEDPAGNPDPTTEADMFDIDTLHVAGEPYYIDVWAEYSAPMSITLNANEVAWPKEGLYSEWNSPEYALESDDEYAFLTKDTSWCFFDQEVTLRLNFETPPEDLENYTITSVKLKVEQMIRSDFFAVTDDTWEFGVGDKNDCTWWWDTWITRPGTFEEHTMSIDITHEYWCIFPVYKLTWDDLKDIAVEITPDHDESESGEWYIDNVWLEINYVYHDKGPSITVPVGGEANVYANVTDWFNVTVPDGKPIDFETDLGTVYPLTDYTTSGIAMTSIISTDVGTATVHASGSANGSCEVTFVAHTLDVELSPGWNLISVPRELENTSIEAVFDGITTITKVYTYQDGDWYGSEYDGAWDELITGFPIEDIEDGIGYWVYATEPTTVTLSLEPLGYVEVIPPDYDLSDGWTMVGYTTLQLEPEMPVPVYLTNLDGKWQSLYSYSPLDGYDQAKPDYEGGFEYTEIGRGYWIYLNEVGVLVP